jgi:hypothetical protein
MALKKLDGLHWLLIALLGLLSALFFLTPYTYHEYAGVLVRIHRLTGNADLLQATGWERMRNADDEDAPTARTPSGLTDDLGILDKR